MACYRPRLPRDTHLNVTPKRKETLAVLRRVVRCQVAEESSLSCYICYMARVGGGQRILLLPLSVNCNLQMRIELHAYMSASARCAPTFRRFLPRTRTLTPGISFHLIVVHSRTRGSALFPSPPLGTSTYSAPARRSAARCGTALSLALARALQKGARAQKQIASALRREG